MSCVSDFGAISHLIGCGGAPAHYRRSGKEVSKDPRNWFRSCQMRRGRNHHFDRVGISDVLASSQRFLSLDSIRWRDAVILNKAYSRWNDERSCIICGIAAKPCQRMGHSYWWND